MGEHLQILIEELADEVSIEYGLDEADTYDLKVKLETLVEDEVTMRKR
jgi:hypothetical protein